MDPKTLQIFSRQLAHWAETAIDRGRYPFRRVETAPPVISAAGEFRPPLVFWINRDSFMAGGVLLLPDKEAEEAVEMGRHCADALGLRHFVTWASQEIVFWEVLGDAVTRHKTLSLPAGCNHAAEDFREALTAILEELKVLCVLGSVAPQQLSAHYLANLCRTSFAAALPHIEEAYRLVRSEDRTGRLLLVEEQAFQKGFLTLLRLLGLIFHDRLPNAVQPEGLERAMQFALDILPPALGTALRPADGEVPLPLESAVRFHHLLRRLTQLQCGKDRPRARLVLEILRDHYAGQLGAFPIPPEPGPAGGLTLLINPDRPWVRGEATIEVASPSQLALLGLLRELEASAPAQLQTADPFSLSLTTRPTAIRGTLTDQSVPDEAGRRLLVTQLRNSWPTRRFSLPRRTPIWAWTLIHLLGLAGEEAEIVVQVPGDWLSADFGDPLLRLLAEEYTLQTLAPTAGQGLILHLVRGGHPEVPCTLEGPDGPRQFSWPRLGSTHRAFLRLALELPSSLFRLLEAKTLRIVDDTSWPEAFEPEIFLFTRSPLGTLLWAQVSAGQPLPPAQSLRPQILRQGLPIPDDCLLADLRQLTIEGPEKINQAIFDSELARLLGLEDALPQRPGRKNRSRSDVTGSAKRPDTDELVSRIAAIVFSDGLPRFPEQYLYDHYRPALSDYKFIGPLRILDEFFGRVQLIDQQGQVIEVEGTESAKALLLASYGRVTAVSLPAEEQLTATILARYLADLRALHRELIRQCHLQVAEARAADALAERVWQSLPVPPWPLLES